MSREMQVEYLARLILQYENSPYIDDRDLVRCQESLPLVVCADASTICVAWGRRIVVLPTHANTHPLFFAAAVTPSTAEMITSMRCLRVPGSDDMLLVVGTSAGFVQVHHPTSSGDARCDQRKLGKLVRVPCFRFTPMIAIAPVRNGWKWHRVQSAVSSLPRSKCLF